MRKEGHTRRVRGKSRQSFRYCRLVKESDIIACFQPYSSLQASQATMFRSFLEAFMEYNAHTNISAIRQAPDIIEKHCIDSIMLLVYASLQEKKVLDIGTG